MLALLLQFLIMIAVVHFRRDQSDAFLLVNCLDHGDFALLYSPSKFSVLQVVRLNLFCLERARRSNAVLAVRAFFALAEFLVRGVKGFAIAAVLCRGRGQD